MRRRDRQWSEVESQVKRSSPGCDDCSLQYGLSGRKEEGRRQSSFYRLLDTLPTLQCQQCQPMPMPAPIPMPMAKVFVSSTACFCRNYQDPPMLPILLDFNKETDLHLSLLASPVLLSLSYIRRLLLAMSSFTTSHLSVLSLYGLRRYFEEAISSNP